MNKSTAKGVLGALLSLALVACGGGETVAAPEAAPQMSAATEGPIFNVRAALNHAVLDTNTLSFKVEGESNGTAYRGTGTYEQGALHTVSEFNSQGGALRKLIPVRMTLQVNDKPVTVEAKAEEFYTREDLHLLGKMKAAPAQEFTEVISFSALPTSVGVGASGSFYSAVRYSDSTRQAQLGTTRATYSVEPDTVEGSALLVVRVVDARPDSSPRSTTTTTYRITAAGTGRLLSESTVDTTTATTLNLRFM